MKCQWQPFISILPVWMRNEVDWQGKDALQELRMRMNQPPELNLGTRSVWLQRRVTGEDLSYTLNAASRYSPWSAATISHGYVTAPGGHRLGVCGDAVVQNGSLTGIRSVSSLCVRVARDFPGIAKDPKLLNDSVLIIGKPGTGKTTLLRDLIRYRSDYGQGSVAVVDERGELFPCAHGTGCFHAGDRTDVLVGASKQQGIDCVLRAMGPSCIAVDEITAQEDCQALMRAGFSGVDLLATAHASSRHDLFSRPIYRSIVNCHLFQWLVVLKPDKTYVVERMDV